jgi:MFS transporter, DHA1 family, tetracycline resistance protein
MIMETNYKKRTLFAIFLTFAIANISATIVFPIFAPLFLKSNSAIIASNTPEHIRLIYYGVFLAAFPAAQFLFAPLAGEYADRKGRKGAFLATLILESIGYGIAALGIHFNMLLPLFLGRVVTGLSAGNMSICLASLVDLSSSEKQKVRYFSYGSIVIGSAFVFGPFLGGKLSDPTILPIFTKAFPMFIGMILALINFVLMIFLFKETLQEKINEPFDLFKSFHNLQLAFRTGQIKTLYLIYFFYLLAWNFLYQFVPAFLVSRFGATTSMIGNVSAVMGIFWILGGYAFTHISQKPQKRKIILLVGLLIYSFSSYFIQIPKHLSTFYMIAPFSIFFIGGMWPIFTSMISACAEQEIQGKILGLSQSIQSLTMMIAPLIGCIVVTHHISLVFALSSIFSLIAALLLTKICFKSVSGHQ